MTVARLFGVRIVLSGWFLLLFAFLGAAGVLAEAALLFAVALAHELAHVAAARLCGLEVAEVELFPFGGVARLEGPLELDPAAEAKVALAGPLANALAAGALLALKGWEAMPCELARRLLEANLLIGGFNLIPALPLDGGRVYRAWLSERAGFLRATERAARLGRRFGLAIAAAGLLLLVLGVTSASVPAVGAFLFAAARKEEEQGPYAFMRYLARRREVLGRLSVQAVRHVVASETVPVKDVLARLAPRRYHIVWVVGRDGRLAGFAGERELIDALFAGGIETPLGAVLGPSRPGG